MTLSDKFLADNFSPEKFIKDFSSICIGVDELRQQKLRIQEIAITTSIELKQNVYQNYVQFIETAKEISHLESEMYQLSQFLSEQRSLLSFLGSHQNSGVVSENNLKNQRDIDMNLQFYDKVSKMKILNLLENVEGAMCIAEVPGRICLYESSLLELDPLEGMPIKRVHAFLFNDIFMIASWLGKDNQNGPFKYRMQIVYDLQNIAIVNVKDLGIVKFAFKLLAFPDTRVFQCINATNKKDWLEKYDQTKIIQNSSMYQNQLITELGSMEIISNNSSRELQLKKIELADHSFFDKTELSVSLPSWILEIIENLDSYIAQRHFEMAYSLLQKVQIFMEDRKINFATNELFMKFSEKSKFLTDVLIHELDLRLEVKSFQGGDLRNARRVIRLLLKLHHHAQACQLYLSLCSMALKLRLKRVKKEGATIPYVKQLSSIAFSNFGKIIEEFLKNFPFLSNCNSALIVWCSQELKLFVSHLIKQIFIPQVSLSTLVESIATIRIHCEQLTCDDIDFRYQLNSQLRKAIAKSLHDTKEKYIEAVKIRALEENWNPCYFRTTENLQKLLTELNDQGINIPSSYVENEIFVTLTNNTLTFSKLYRTLLEDCFSICTFEILNIIEDVLISVMLVQTFHLQSSFANPLFEQKRQLIRINTEYIHDIILAQTLELYKKNTGREFKKLIELQEVLWTDILSYCSKPKPAPRSSIAKYSTAEYL